jgi:ParB family transcriptional regulator, chromosome partitioning protein
VDQPQHICQDRRAARPGNAALTLAAAILPLCKGQTMTTITPLDPRLIHAAGAADRLESDAMEDARLAGSIRDHGQQVPILVRPDATRPGHYQIVYGRRRTLACLDLGIPVQAIVAPMDDAALLMAQGQENTARRNLSFAEKAHFARQLADAGHDRAFICAALSVSITELSRMTQITNRVPAALLETIGAAPDVGRDRWTHFASLISQDGVTSDDLVALVNTSDAPTSNARFQVALDTLLVSRAKTRCARKHREVTIVITDEGNMIGRAEYLTKRTRLRLATRQVTVDLDPRRCDGFDDWLVQNLSHLYRDWLVATLTKPD